MFKLHFSAAVDSVFCHNHYRFFSIGCLGFFWGVCVFSVVVFFLLQCRDTYDEMMYLSFPHSMREQIIISETESPSV